MALFIFYIHFPAFKTNNHKIGLFFSAHQMEKDSSFKCIGIVQTFLNEKLLQII